MPCIFISGINTDSGKTVVTGLIARYLLSQGKRVTTSKLVQTGCQGIASDILVHRQIMAQELTRFDEDGTTCSHVFDHPASPHLSARMENRAIDLDHVAFSIGRLQQEYDWVLVEGAGGLLVPLTENETTLDFVQRQQFPVVLVADSKLGSINHSLLSIECLKHRGVPLHGVVYNMYPVSDRYIAEDNLAAIRSCSEKMFPLSHFYHVPKLDFPCTEVVGFPAFTDLQCCR